MSEQYDPHKTTPEQLNERKAPAADATFLVYHGTDATSGESIRTGDLKLISARFHDFARGANTAFYFTTSRDLAIRFARERAETTGDTAGALVTVTLTRSAVKLYEFESVDEWRELVNFNRDRDIKKKEQHELVKTHDILGGWISTVSPTLGRVPVAYVSDASGKAHFDWQYVAVSSAGLAGLFNKSTCYRRTML